jgi:BASS family bile acid:Na+ symporter
MNDALNAIARLSVPVFIVSTMLAMGLGLSPRAIMAPLRNPRLVAVVLIVNFFLSPAIAYGLTRLVPLEPPYTIGLLLLSVAAGAPFLPKLAEATRADLSLVVAFMVLLTAGTILLMPFELPVLIPGFQASPLAIAKPLLTMMALPLVAAMIVGPRARQFSAVCKPILTVVANVSVVVVLVLFIGLNASALWGVVGSGAIAVSAVYTALVFAAGFLLGGPQPAAKGALGLTTSARNVAAALPVASVQSDPKVVVMLLVATLTGLVVTLTAAKVVRRRLRGSPEASGCAQRNLS